MTDCLNDEVINAAAALIDAQSNGRLHHFYTAVFDVNNCNRKLSPHAFQQYRVNHRIKSKRSIVSSQRKSQILLVNCNHWVLVSNDHDGPVNEVRVYNSHKTKPNSAFVHQVAAVYAFEDDRFTVQSYPVQQQTDGSSCGVFFLAFLQAIGVRIDPTETNISEKVSLLYTAYKAQRVVTVLSICGCIYSTV